MYRITPFSAVNKTPKLHDICVGYFDPTSTDTLLFKQNWGEVNVMLAAIYSPIQ